MVRKTATRVFSTFNTATNTPHFCIPSGPDGRRKSGIYYTLSPTFEASLQKDELHNHIRKETYLFLSIPLRSLITKSITSQTSSTASTMDSADFDDDGEKVPPKPYGCLLRDCQCRYATPAALQSHLKSNHLDRHHFSCAICSFRISSYTSQEKCKFSNAHRPRMTDVQRRRWYACGACRCGRRR